MEYNNNDRLCLHCEKVIDTNSVYNLCKDCMKELSIEDILKYNICPPMFYKEKGKEQ